MLLSDSSRVAPEAFRFRRTGMGLKVGLILPANGEADSSGHPEACGSQPLDLALIGNRQSCCEASETERALPIATVCRSTRCVSISSSGQCQRVASDSHSQSLVNPLPFKVQLFLIARKTLNSGPAPFAHRFDATLMCLDDSFDEA